MCNTTVMKKQQKKKNNLNIKQIYTFKVWWVLLDFFTFSCREQSKNNRFNLASGTFEAV